MDEIVKNFGITSKIMDKKGVNQDRSKIFVLLKN